MYPAPPVTSSFIGPAGSSNPRALRWTYNRSGLAGPGIEGRRSKIGRAHTYSTPVFPSEPLATIRCPLD
jgi:hypothetical protein